MLRQKSLLSFSVFSCLLFLFPQTKASAPRKRPRWQSTGILGKRKKAKNKKRTERISSLAEGGFPQLLAGSRRNRGKSDPIPVVSQKTLERIKATQGVPPIKKSIRKIPPYRQKIPKTPRIIDQITFMEKNDIKRIETPCQLTKTESKISEKNYDKSIILFAKTKEEEEEEAIEILQKFHKKKLILRSRRFIKQVYSLAGGFPTTQSLSILSQSFDGKTFIETPLTETGQSLQYSELKKLAFIITNLYDEKTDMQAFIQRNDDVALEELIKLGFYVLRNLRKKEKNQHENHHHLFLSNKRMKKLLNNSEEFPTQKMFQ